MRRVLKRIEARKEQKLATPVRSRFCSTAFASENPAGSPWAYGSGRGEQGAHDTHDLPHNVGVDVPPVRLSFGEILRVGIDD